MWAGAGRRRRDASARTVGSSACNGKSPACKGPVTSSWSSNSGSSGKRAIAEGGREVHVRREEDDAADAISPELLEDGNGGSRSNPCGPPPSAQPSRASVPVGSTAERSRRRPSRVASDEASDRRSQSRCFAAEERLRMRREVGSGVRIAVKARVEDEDLEVASASGSCDRALPAQRRVAGSGCSRGRRRGRRSTNRASDPGPPFE
jgi:hypothetical protein